MKILLKTHARKERLKRDLQLKKSDKTVIGLTFAKYFGCLTKLCVALLLKRISPVKNKQKTK